MNSRHPSASPLIGLADVGHPGPDSISSRPKVSNPTEHLDSDTTGLQSPTALPEHAIFTIGHSTRTIAEVVALLRQVNVDLVADVRSIPHSRAYPQFDLDSLPGSLAAEGIGYRHLPKLGGRRHHPKDAPPSTNTFWRLPAFRDYADYAETEPFREGLVELLELARGHRVAVMCAEAVWWRCHRRIIADYLLARDRPVRHILGPGQVTPAFPTPGVSVGADGILRYPSPAEEQPPATR